MNVNARVVVTNSKMHSVTQEGTVVRTNGVGPMPIRVRFDDGSSDLFAAWELRVL
jgi:hypothetical protein